MNKIAIHSVPRSGSTWLGQIFNSHKAVKYCFQPLFSYALKSFLNETSSKRKIDEFFQLLAQSNDDFITQKISLDSGKPEFEKVDPPTHIVYKEVRYHHILENLLEKDKDIKVIGLIRSPHATINSWLRAPKEFRVDKNWKIEDEWLHAEKKNLDKIEEFNGYLKWKEVASLFLKLNHKYKERFYLLEYKNLVHNPKLAVKELFSFTELKVEQETLDFLTTSKSTNSTNAYSVFKTKIDDETWRKQLPAYITKHINEDLANSSLLRFVD